MKCGYKRQIWHCGDTIEVEEKHTGRYGARGQKREKKEKPSKEDIKRQNQWKRVRDLRRVIKWNFKKNDYWITLTYQKGYRPSYQEVLKDMQEMIRIVRRKYRKQGVELKYIFRIAIGKRGGVHVHILVNRFANEQTGSDVILSECWTKGHVNFRTLYDSGGYKDLAEYIAKELEEWEPETMKRFHPSRNLIRKDPEEKVIHRRSLIDRRGIPIQPKASKGYYIDEESVEMGINKYTGFAYRRYILVKLDRRD